MSGGIYTTDKSKTLQSLADVDMDSPLNNQAPVYNSTTELFENKHVATSSSSISGSSGDVVIADGSGGVLTTTKLNVNPTNGTISGTYINITEKEVKLADGAGANAGVGTKNISIGHQAGNTTTNSDVISIGATAGQGLAKADSINIGRGSGFSSGIDSINIGRVSGFGSGTNSISVGYNANANNDNCIVINAFGTNTQSQQADSCYINPIRNVNATTILNPYNVHYDEATKELFRSEDIYTRDITCRNIQNAGTLTNVSTASLYNGQLTVGTTVNRAIIGAPNAILSVDLQNRRVGINKLNPTEDLDVDGNIQLNGATTSKIVFYDSNDAHEHAEIDSTDDGVNGGQLQLHTKVDSGSVTEKLRINNVGAFGIADGAGGITYGSPGQVLQTNGSGSPVSWVNQGGTPVASKGYLDIPGVSGKTIAPNSWYDLELATAFGGSYLTTLSNITYFNPPTTGIYFANVHLWLESPTPTGQLYNIRINFFEVISGVSTLRQTYLWEAGYPPPMPDEVRVWTVSFGNLYQLTAGSQFYARVRVVTSDGSSVTLLNGEGNTSFSVHRL